jgi:acyl carrier protein
MTKSEENNHTQDPQVDKIALELCGYLKGSIVDKNLTVEPDTSFSKIGIDSLAIIELVLFVERKFNVALPEQELIPENFKSARTLAICTRRYFVNDAT